MPRRTWLRRPDRNSGGRFLDLQDEMRQRWQERHAQPERHGVPQNGTGDGKGPPGERAETDDQED
jgi:hypothetical protein